MGSLIDDLLNFARATTVPVKSMPVDLRVIAVQTTGYRDGAADQRGAVTRR
jgi:hypothetical protein